MLCADISHKILRTDTVLDLFYSLKSDPDFHNSVTRSIVGEIVLTRSDATCTCAASLCLCMHASTCTLCAVHYNQTLEVLDHISGLVDLYIFLVLSVGHLVIMYLTNSFKL